MTVKLNIGLVKSRFNAELCDNLVDGARLFFERREEAFFDTRTYQQEVSFNIETFAVPGAYELPLGVQWLIEMAKERQSPLDGVVALGVVIRGETPHFDYVAGPAAQGIMQVGLNHSLPVGFGLITADTYEQAANRANLTTLTEEADTKENNDRRDKKSNKGYEAAAAVWAMILERQKHIGDSRWQFIIRRAMILER